MRPKRGTLTTTLPPGRPQAHGGYSFLATGKLPEHRRAVLAYLSAARAGLIKDQGPTEQDLTTAQIILIDRTVTALGVVRCIEEYIRENSVMAGRNVAPALQASYLAYVNHVRLNLVALGVKTRAGKGVLDLGTYLREHDKKKSQAKARKTNAEPGRGQGKAKGSSGQQTAGEKKIDPGATSSDISEKTKGGIDCRAADGQDQAPEGMGIGQPGALQGEGEG